MASEYVGRAVHDFAKRERGEAPPRGRKDEAETLSLLSVFFDPKRTSVVTVMTVVNQPTEDASHLLLRLPSPDGTRGAKSTQYGFVGDERYPSGVRTFGKRLKETLGRKASPRTFDKRFRIRIPRPEFQCFLPVRERFDDAVEIEERVRAAKMPVMVLPVFLGYGIEQCKRLFEEFRFARCGEVVVGAGELPDDLGRAAIRRHRLDEVDDAPVIFPGVERLDVFDGGGGGDRVFVHGLSFS